MESSKRYSLGELIELCTDINDNGEYTASDVMGMTITKEVIPTKANVENTDLNNFLIIRPKEFIYNPRTHGKRIGFGFNDTDKSFIISWNNIGFKVKKEAKEIVIPEYLFMHFNRLEWDREACYRSWGTSTEVFSWDALCGMKIELPTFSTQQKVVAIYNELKENLVAYESGLENLKLACDGFIEDLKKKYSGTKLEKYLQYSDKRNDEDLDLSHVRGLSIDKKLIPTKANMQDVGLDKYKMLEPGQFAYVPVTSRNGEKITIALNDTDEKYLVSSAYEVFGIDADNVCPSYLMMFFTRPEFDRYARFHSWGSARESFDWTELCNVEIPLPDIRSQKSIADIYSCYIERKRIAEELRERLKNICPILLKGALMATD